MKKILLSALTVFTIMAQAANPFFGTYKTPHQTVPFDKIKLSHYEPAFQKAIEENQKEIDAIVNQRSMPTFENTIEALDRSGQMLNRVASVFFALLSAESNDEMMEISQRVQPLLSEHSNNISLNETLFERIKFVYDRRDQLDLMASVLLERETVEGEAVEALLNNEWASYLERTGAAASAGAQASAKPKLSQEELEEDAARYAEAAIAAEAAVEAEAARETATGDEAAVDDAAKDAAEDAASAEEAFNRES